MKKKANNTNTSAYNGIRINYSEATDRFNINMSADDFARMFHSMHDFSSMVALDEVESGRACGTAIVAVRDRIRKLAKEWEKRNHQGAIRFLEAASSTCASSYGLLDGLYTAMLVFIERNVDLRNGLGLDTEKEERAEAEHE